MAVLGVCMPNMFAGGLMSSPPVSNTTPFPTMVTFGCAGSPQEKSARRGSRTDALPTAWMSGNGPEGSVRRLSPTMTVALAPNLAARSTAAACGERGRGRGQGRGWLGVEQDSLCCRRSASAALCTAKRVGPARGDREQADALRRTAGAPRARRGRGRTRAC